MSLMSFLFPLYSLDAILMNLSTSSLRCMQITMSYCLKHLCNFPPVYNQGVKSIRRATERLLADFVIYIRDAKTWRTTCVNCVLKGGGGRRRRREMSRFFMGHLRPAVVVVLVKERRKKITLAAVQQVGYGVRA